VGLKLKILLKEYLINREIIMKKYINPSAILYIIILIVVTLLIGFATEDNIKKEGKVEILTNNIENKMQIIILETSLGNIELELFTDVAPDTVTNFLKLAREGFYENTKFHRVIKGFMIQGGDPYTKGEDTTVYGTGGPGYKFADEPNNKPMVRGTLAMANSGPNTNGSQFFIVTAVETPWLFGKHTAFGKVISGMEVVDKIENSRTNENDLPVTPIIVTKIVIN
jgi:cyclophilin family peptidyl-prolyl cis-trans isomerase